MSEADALVLNYLTTVSDKLAKQFSKKRPSPVPWTGPDLVKLIEFYRKHCNEETPVTEVTTVEPPAAEVNGEEGKRGKKRKVSEMTEDGTAVGKEGSGEQTGAEKKKKKKKKKKGAKVENGLTASPDVVEVIQVADEKQETVETPGPEENGKGEVEEGKSEQDKPTENGSTGVGGLVSAGQEEQHEAEGEETKKKVKKSKLKRQNNSFRRVKEEEVEIKKEELADNTFEAKGGADQYGFKANQILKHTKGKSFRHEKTKKKRGTYKGGVINMGVTSIKFDSD